MRFPLAGWAWPPGPRVAAAHDSDIDGQGADGRKKDPMQATSGRSARQTSPCRPGRRPTRYKTLPARPKTLILAQFAPAGRTLYRFRGWCRYKTLPARGLGRTRYKTLPARPKTQILTHFAPAGRTLYRFRGWCRYKTLPARGLGRPTRYKTLPARPKTLIWPILRQQGELCTVSATYATSRAKEVTHQHPTSPHPSNAPLPQFRMQFDCLNFQ